MVQHKSVHFHCHEGKTGRAAEKFREPEGMTTIDLKNVHVLEQECAEVLEEKSPSTKHKPLRKFIVKTIVIGCFITFGMITVFAIAPPQNIYSFVKSWPNISHSSKNISDDISPSELMQLISAYTKKIDDCKELQRVDDCCAILASLYDDFVVETCNIDTIMSLVGQFNDSTVKIDNSTKQNNITLDAYYKYNTNVNDDQIYYDENNYLDTEIIVSDMIKPIIENGNVDLEGDDIDILLSNDRIVKEKRKLLKKRQTQYSLNNEELNYQYVEYENDVPPKMLDSYGYQQYLPTIHELPSQTDYDHQQHQYYETPTENSLQTNVETRARKFKFVDSKSSQPPTLNGEHKDNAVSSLNSALTSTQCVPFIPSTYDPSPRYADLLPLNRNPYYPYAMNPSYFPMPQLPTQYQYNPFYIPQNPIPASIQATNPSGQFFICNPVPAPTTNHLTAIPGVEVRHSSGLSLQDMLDEITEPHSNKTRNSDLCRRDKVLCGDESKCVEEYKVCDNEVDCKDASDEIGCSCIDRIGPSRLCDGYYDCPNGEDEWNCFGCKKDTFSCEDWGEGTRVTCVPIEQRCDGIVQCRTGKDEDDCSILSETFGKPLSVYKISNSAGFLYKNYKGEWYPACSNSEVWAINACEKESGSHNISPITHMIPVQSEYKGPYANASPKNEIVIVNSCIPDFAVYVQCPSPICGRRAMGKRLFHSEEVDDSNEDAKSKFRDSLGDSITKNDKLNADVLGDRRVVGGSSSRPAAWPWVVSIYRNGYFHCGGVIITEFWILTAAHCVDKFSKYYFEVEAGILRRLSYSPMQQTRFVTYVVCHEAYDRAVLKNDLALIKLDTPLKFNRYIRPICLPSEASAGRNYRSAPPPGTLCTAIGWGATFEHGPDPDHLREVEVPVLKHCKYPDDEEGREICAGYVEGGKDACQGDSGGPFMCRNPNSPDQWYLAGIVSHGDGCARPNEPGVYTRVSLYLEWIFENIHSNLHPLNIPLIRCPGYECKGTKKCLPKRNHCDKMVDCLLGDDERHCERPKMATLFEQAMRRMIMLGSALPPSEVNKSVTAEDTTEETRADTDRTTLITNGGNPVALGVGADSIYTFKMENSDDQTEAGLFASESESFTTEWVETSTDNLWDISNSDQTPTTSAFEDTTKFETDAITEAKDGVQTTTTSKPPNKFFRCTRMLQLVPLSRRCDKFVDCEDGTDEMNCTCLDYLRALYKQGICDGISDCADLSDEMYCGDTCSDNEFRCWISFTCVEGSKKCDSIQDCPHNEDEWDCFALTDANALLLDGDLRPHLNTKGVVSFYHNRTWMPLCFDWYQEFAIASDVCHLLNLNDYVNYRIIDVEDKPLKVVTPMEEDVNMTRINENDSCNALYVTCSNRVVTEHRLQDTSSVTNDLIPWNVAIYADGEYKCTGTLLNLNWVLTSVNCFRGISNRYVTILAGIGTSYMNVEGPHEQQRLALYSTRVLYSDAILLKTEKKFSFTRYVRPLGLPTRDDAFRKFQYCMAVGRKENQTMEMILLHSISTCTSGSQCFKRVFPHKEKCYQKQAWSGVIICESKQTLYPAAIFHESQGVCGFNQTAPFTALWLLSKGIYDIIADNYNSFVLPPVCKGFRCSLGDCIDFKKVCDGISDCRSGEDELERSCIRKSAFDQDQCNSLYLKCNNGKCIQKSAFCDGNDDCGDDSDEPRICSCHNYMNLTHPSKICDGIINCEDKGDENPKICGCSDEKFKCTSNNTCVPFEMVCDGEQDCPHGEDEAQCIILKNPVESDLHKQGEVTLRTAGVWHSGCFSSNMSTSDLSEICISLGFENHVGSYGKIPQESDIIPGAVSKRFDIVWIHANPKLRLALRSGREPLVRFDASKRCFKLFIKCSGTKL